ncbi:MAG: hypothetical protein HC913_06650 [Microscillaceae bacterium]|nr:hypothetical protein [Microscillaceae bacterium]
MKQTIQLLIALVLCWSLMACGGGEKATNNADSTQADTAEANKTTEATEVSEESPELSEEAQPFVKKWSMTSFSHNDGRKEENISNRILNLKEDGTFEEFFNKRVIASGTWNVSKEGERQMLVLTHKTGEMSTELKDGEEKLTVKEISADKMITEDDGGKMSETFVPASE